MRLIYNVPDNSFEYIIFAKYCLDSSIKYDYKECSYSQTSVDKALKGFTRKTKTGWSVNVQAL